MAIRRVSYLSVQNQVADNLGWDSSNLSTEDQLLIRNKINLWAQFGWDAFFFPEWTICEKRLFRQPWDSVTNWVAGDEVYHRPSRKYYIALQANSNQEPATGSAGVYTTNLQYWAEAGQLYSAEEYSATKTYVRGEKVYYPSTDKYYQLYAATSTGNLPTDATKWGELAAFERYIDYEQSWETTLMGDAKEAWNANPRIEADNAQKVDMVLQDNGVRILGNDPVIWLEFRKRPPSWTGSIYSASSTYAVNDQVYFTDGDYWKCTTATNAGESPLTHPAKWERVDFPYVLSKFVIEGAYAAVMGKNDGQQEKYPSESSEAYQLLLAEFDKIERQQNQGTQLNVAA